MRVKGRERMKLNCVTAMILVLTGCASFYPRETPTIGMSAAEIRAAWDEPHETWVVNPIGDEQQEAWSYFKRGSWWTVSYADGRVVRVTEY